jgi:uncharacterized protein (TIGR02246 family)
MPLAAPVMSATRPSCGLWVVRRAFAAFSAGDMDALMNLFTDDAVVQTDPTFPEGGTLVGHEPIRRFHEGLHEGWHGGGAVIATDVRTAGDRVFVSVDWTATGEASGIETSSRWHNVAFVRDSKIGRWQYFVDRAEALDAARLPG